MHLCLKNAIHYCAVEFLPDFWIIASIIQNGQTTNQLVNLTGHIQHKLDVPKKYHKESTREGEIQVLPGTLSARMNYVKQLDRNDVEPVLYEILS